MTNYQIYTITILKKWRGITDESAYFFFINPDAEKGFSIYCTLDEVRRFFNKKNHQVKRIEKKDNENTIYLA